MYSPINDLVSAPEYILSTDARGDLPVSDPAQQRE
jgi:hypothetical protein